MTQEKASTLKAGDKLTSWFKGHLIIWTLKDTYTYELTAKNGLKSHLTPTNLWAFTPVVPVKFNSTQAKFTIEEENNA
jgi:hypothetical protein